MAYIIRAFDGLEAPPYLQDGDTQSIGTGQAATNFTDLAGGGFFDNYGSIDAPRTIQPITKRAVIWGDTAEDTKDVLDSWRKKIGKRGKLTVKFDDGSLRWQWARLQNISPPRRVSDTGWWLSVDMTWVTSDQTWRGVISSEEEWTWGDNTWTFGDGTAEFGEQDNMYTVTSSPYGVTAANGGNIDATNLRISFTPNVELSSVTFTNQTTGDYVSMFGPTTLTAGEEIIIDCGSMAVTIDGADAYNYFVKNTTGQPWLPLSPGDNTIVTTYTGAAGAVSAPWGLAWYEYYA